MSRTTLPRGERRVDYYPTPAWCVRRLLEAVDLPGGRWLEPAVGDGAIVRAVNALRADVHWTTIDVRPECEPDLCADFVAPLYAGDVDDYQPEGDWDVCITNPPFSQATEFVVEALRRARVVAMLLRLGWLASQERRSLIAESMPSVYVLPDRPSFLGDGGSDSADYAWMVWSQEPCLVRGLIRVLATTPIHERRTP